MTCFSPQASDMVQVTYQRFLPYAQTGRELTPHEVTSLLKNLLTIRAVAREQEEEMRILEQRLAACGQKVRSARTDVVDGTVVPFPAPTRMLPPDGGDAA